LIKCRFITLTFTFGILVNIPVNKNHKLDKKNPSIYYLFNLHKSYSFFISIRKTSIDEGEAVLAIPELITDLVNTHTLLCFFLRKPSRGICFLEEGRRQKLDLLEQPLCCHSRAVKLSSHGAASTIHEMKDIHFWTANL
ncbi:hypothetical protein ACJX0J_023479, partial [Zea mays]